MNLHRNRFLYGAVGVVVTLVWIGPALAQIPDEFTNLEILPNDISKRELVSIMREFSGALGGRCNTCHVGENPNSLEGYDFASDEKKEKKIARVMMKMTAEINGTFLPETGIESAVEVRCVTCHRGVEHPETLDRVLKAEIDEGGVDAAAAEYRKLREQYYGNGSYNFSAGTLNTIAESLAQGETGDADGAIALMKLNLEFNPEASYSHLLLGQIYAGKGDMEAAIASVERCLELDPENRWAKRTLEKMKNPE